MKLLNINFLKKNNQVVDKKKQITNYDRFCEIGKLVKEARIKNNLSIKELSNISKIPESSLNSIENNIKELRPKYPFLRSILFKLAKCLSLKDNTLVGLAIKESCDYIQKNINHIKNLEKRFIEQLDNYKINYILHIKKRLPGVLAVAFPKIDGQSLLIALDLKGIAISFGSACSSGTSKASKTLLEIGMDEKLAKNTVRISFGKFNTANDIKYLISILQNIMSSKISEVTSHV